MDKMKMKKRLTEKISGSLVQENAPMAKFTSFRAGGCADLLVQPQNIKELQDVLQVLQEEGCPHMVLGNGSNVLVKDGGYRGVMVKLNGMLVRDPREHRRRCVHERGSIRRGDQGCAPQSFRDLTGWSASVGAGYRITGSRIPT